MEKMIMDDEEYLNLCYLFQTDVKLAIGYSETILTENYQSSFNNFLKEQILNSHPSSCQSAWNSRRLVIHCKECSINDSGCICLSCYDKEQHKNHHVSIRFSSSGNCSCGNLISWKEEGFCNKHNSPDPSPETTQLTKELFDKLLIIFSAAYLKLNFRAIYQPVDCISIFKWTKKLAHVNDGYRRCIVIALLKKANFSELLQNIDAYDIDINLAMSELFSDLLCDKFFAIHFAQTVYKLQIDYVQLYLRFTRNNIKPTILEPIIQLTAHAYSPLVFNTVLNTFDFDWSVLVVNFFLIVAKLLNKDNSGATLYNSQLNKIASNVLLLTETGIKRADDQNRILILFNALTTTFSKIEGLHPFSYYTPSEKTDFIGLNTLNQWISRLSYSFENTSVPLTGDLIFTSIFRFFINYFIPDKFDTDKQIPLFRRSIQGHALFTPIMPNHMFISILLYKNRDHLIEFLDRFISGALSMSDLTLMLSILPLRWLVACHSSMTQVIPVASRSINYLVKNFLMANMIVYSFVPLFSLVQICFGLMPTSKESFIATISHLYGLYNDYKADDLDDTIIKKQRFAFLFMIVCLLTDHLCFDRDVVGIGRSMLSIMLFRKPTSVRDITKTLAPIFLDNMSLSDELDLISERVVTKKGNLFKLKHSEEKTCHPFRPWMKISQVIYHMSLLHQISFDQSIEKDIDKNKNKFDFYFPEIRKDENDLTFSVALKSVTLKMWVYIIILDSLLRPDLMSIESCDIIVNLLLKMSAYEDHIPKTDKNLEVVKIPNYDDFRLVLHNQCDDFDSFMWTPFDLSLFLPHIYSVNNSKPAFSMVDILIKLENGMYKDVLPLLNIGYKATETTEHQKEIELRKSQREKAKKLRDQIQNEFKQKMKSFTKKSSGSTVVQTSPKHHHHHDNIDDNLSLEQTTESNNHNTTTPENDQDHNQNNFNPQLENSLQESHNHQDLTDENNNELDAQTENSNLHRNENSASSSSTESDDDDDLDFDENPNNVICNICNIYNIKKEDEFCYPCLVINTIIPSLIASSTSNQSVDLSKLITLQIPKKQLMMRICPHLVHSSCVGYIDSKFRCPVDRMKRNCLLPRLEHKGYSSLSSNEVLLIRTLLKNPLFFTRTNNQFETLVDVFVGSIMIDEARLRLLPGCLDGKIHYLLLRNLYLLLWHCTHSEQLSLTSDSNEWNPLKSLVSDMIMENSPLEKFTESVKRISKEILSKRTVDESICEKDLIMFLRRATILELLPLSDQEPSFIDWDEVLSYTNLSSRFLTDLIDIQSNEIPHNSTEHQNQSMKSLIVRSISFEIDPFTLIKLPHEYLDLAREPYNLQIDDMSKEIALCLLTGKLVDVEKQGSSFNHLSDHLETQCFDNPTLLLVISGQKASALFLADKQFNMILSLPTIYVDRFGDEDIGFERGQLLFLNEERLERYTDMLLSGEWTDHDLPE